ncbi:MAG: excinuclease ABC subunit UvrA [Limisphaerales bacterium]
MSTPTAPPAPFDDLPTGSVVIRGAREHNLKGLDVDIPHQQFVVITGVSGSGKSTLAFDLLFAEGQRRFLDSMSAYARQFVEQLGRPDVDLIAGLPPTVSIEQNTARGGGKSTVATVTEIHHFLRLLFARLGTQHCPDCRVPVEPQTRDQLVATLERSAKDRGELTLLAPVIRNRKGFHSEIATWARNEGYQELRADGRWYPTDQPFRLDRFKEHDVEVVIGSFTRSGTGLRITEGRTATRPARGGVTGQTPTRGLRGLVEESLSVGKGVFFALDRADRLTVHSTERACPQCRRSFGPLDPKDFSYNSSQGWCPRCRGFGELFHLPEVDRGANADAVEESWWRWATEREICPDCIGARLKPEARAVRFAGDEDPGTTLDLLGGMSVDQAADWAASIRLSGRSAEIGRDILPEIRERLRFLKQVGLGYLQLGRSVVTLSGGEAQRIRLAAQLGSNLSGVLYILDEPTIGLHPRDNDRLLECLIALRDRGNSLVVVEHDEDTMRRADFVIDLGPGAGVHGGRLVAAGTVPELMRHPDSVTGRHLRELETRVYPSRGQRRPVALPSGSPRGRKKPSMTGESTGWITLEEASLHNLQRVTARFPLGRFTVVTGVSGSGKSTLVKNCLFPGLEGLVAKGGKKGGNPGLGRIETPHPIRAVHEVDQSPIGRTPRSTPATYVGFFDVIRQLFADAQESKVRGYGPGRFSFNSTQGRCPECEGKGFIELEMNFLPSAQIRCGRCEGRRFNPETLDVTWQGKSIADVLDLSVSEALGFFSAHSRLLRPLQALADTGLDYIRLGQTSPTLSGGEAQRIKLVTHLLGGLSGSTPGRLTSRQLQGGDVFILEEPTIGLHMQDVRRLVEVLQRLVDAGHTVIVIEHNLELISEADWVVDLGPEGGAGGGRILAEGTPEQIAQTPGSHTGTYLRSWLRM